MRLAYSGSIKKLFILLAITMLFLLTYSLRYQFSWLPTSEKQILEHKLKGSKLMHLLPPHGSDAAVRSPGSEDPVIRRSKVNNTLLPKQQAHAQEVTLTNTVQSSSIYERGHAQEVTLTNTVQSSSIYERGQDQNSSNFLLQKTVSHHTPTLPPIPQPVEYLLGQSSLEQGQSSLEQGQSSLEQGQSSLEQGQSSLEQGQSSLEQGQSLLEQGQSSLEQGQSSLEQGQSSLEQGQSSLEQGQSSLEQGQSSLTKVPLAKDMLSQKHGYIVVLSIYEQQTMASGNLLQLQCLAKILNLVVVKPFMHDSSLEIPLDRTKQSTELRMEDTIDMQQWNKYASEVGYAPLVEWEEFMEFAPRKLIVVHMKYPTLTQVKAIRDKGLPFPHPPSEEKLFAQDCKFKFAQSKGMASLQKNGFMVVRNVCLNFLTGDELPFKQLQEHIFGEYKDDQVSIIINEWRGLGENQRVLIQEEMCLEEKTYKEHTQPSARILRDSEMYIKQYLHPLNRDTEDDASPYIAVMARYEMTGLTKRLNRQDDPHAIIPACLEATHKGLEDMKIITKIPSVFLSMDVGRYGSESFRNKKYFGHLKDMEEFVSKVYKGEMNIRDWEKTFETISQTQDSGYIAMLQLVLVTRAKCILFVGGGTFQRHALHLYQDLHPDPKDRCVRIIDKCTSPYRPVVK